MQWRTLHIGGLHHAEEEISMSTTVPNFVGEIQQFYFNNIPYIELARALSTEQSISGKNFFEKKTGRFKQRIELKSVVQSVQSPILDGKLQ